MKYLVCFLFFVNLSGTSGFAQKSDSQTLYLLFDSVNPKCTKRSKSLSLSDGIKNFIYYTYHYNLYAGQPLILRTINTNTIEVNFFDSQKLGIKQIEELNQILGVSPKVNQKKYNDVKVVKINPYEANEFPIEYKHQVDFFKRFEKIYIVEKDAKQDKFYLFEVIIANTFE